MYKFIPETLFTGQTMIELDKVGSTNNFAANLLKEQNLTEGTVIMAHVQNEGRGQYANTWESEAYKNLTASFILYPVFMDADKQFLLNIAISLAVYECFSIELGEKLKIKWPNDLYFGNKKLGGMLIENTISGNSLKSSIIGIGLNINQEDFKQANSNPVSLRQITGKEYPIKEVLKTLCECIEARYLQLKAGKTNYQKEQYLKNLYRFGQEASFSSGGVVFEGRITGITNEGRLIVEHSKSEIHYYALKEIKFL